MIDNRTKPPATRPAATVVEFIGVTGVGKSTLFDAVVSQLSAQNYAVVEAHEAIVNSSIFRGVRSPKWRVACLYLLAILPFLRFCLTVSGWRIVRWGMRLIIQHAGSFLNSIRLLRNVVKRIGVHEMLNRPAAGLHKYDFILCDEGIIQIVHNLFVHVQDKPNLDDVRRFVAILPRPDLLVCVTAPKEQSIDCTLKRGHLRVTKSPEAVRAFVDNACAAFAVLDKIPAIKERLLTVDNSIGTNGSDLIGDRSRHIAEELMGRKKGVRNLFSVSDGGAS